MTLTTRPDGSLLASGPNRDADVIRRDARHDPPEHHGPEARGAARPGAAARRSGPRCVRALSCHRVACRSRRRRLPMPPTQGKSSLSPSEPSRSMTRRIRSRLATSCGRIAGRRAAKADRGPSTPCGTPSSDCRDRLCSPLRRRSATPGGTRITLTIDQLDGTIGQGIGRFRLAATTAADPLVGSRHSRALARPC